MQTRTYNLPMDVIAGLMKLWRPEDGDEIGTLRRILKIDPPKTEPLDPNKPLPVGYHDPKFGVTIKHGAIIYRVYQGTMYKAQAVGGVWVRLDTKQEYGSLNELSRSIGAKTENAWWNWFTDLPHMPKTRISDLRDNKKIIRRQRRIVRNAEALNIGS